AWLNDVVFATSISKLETQPENDRERWYAGLQLGAYLSWVGGTAAGAYFGHDWIRDSPILSQTLGFVLPALFLALLLEIRRLVPLSVLAAAALASLLALLLLPAYAVIIIAMSVGALMASRK